MKTLAGTSRLTLVALRRDRLTLPIWILSLSGFLSATTALWASELNVHADLVQDTEVAAASPGIRMLGLASGATIGAYAMVRDFLLLAVLAALMSTFTVVRHTRQGEETGRAELIGAAVVGRAAPLAAAVIMTVAANVVLALFLALGLIAAGQPAAGSFAAGTAVAAVGIVFAGIAAVTSQLTSTTRSASGLAAAVLGVSFLLSGVGNMAGDVDSTGLTVRSAWPSWLSPIGWGQQMRPFGGDHWWPLGLSVAVSAACVALAGLLVSRRDFGSGLVPQHTGPARAGRALRSSFALAFRLQRGALLGWSVAMLGFGSVMGGLAAQVRDSTGASRDWYLRTGGSDSILDAYRASILQMAGVAAATYVVQVLLRMRAEEADGPVEAILATGVGRLRWAAGYAVTALLGATILVLLYALGAGATAGAALGDPAGQIARMIGPAAVQLPGILVLGATVIALVAVLPRYAVVASWIVVLWSILAGPLFGPGLSLPRWALDLSPFTHVPKAPAVAITVQPVAGLLAATAVIACAGFFWLRHRDTNLPA
jgi:ABC-2 type transport system permease protein